MVSITLGNRQVGEGHPPYFIAEIGSNHNGDMQLCKQLIDEAKASGADAVKFQSWSDTSLISKAEYEKNPSYVDKKRHFGSLREMVERYQFTPDMHEEAATYCKSKEITFLSSCFCPEEVDLVLSLGSPAIKVASMDVTHHPLLRYIASKKVPVLLSTGMATLAEIDRAVEILKGCPLLLLHCVAIYPPEFSALNLRNIQTLSQCFQTPVGFSDHTVGITASIAAISLGACMIEKHFTIDKDLDGWDHWISADLREMSALVEEGLKAYSSLGSSAREVSEAEMEKRRSFRRCIVLRHDMGPNDKIALTDLDFKRPGTGIGPDESQHVVGRSLKRKVRADEPLSWDDLID